jgi:hypothetical protein
VIERGLVGRRSLNRTDNEIDQPFDFCAFHRIKRSGSSLRECFGD